MKTGRVEAADVHTKIREFADDLNRRAKEEQDPMAQVVLNSTARRLREELLEEDSDQANLRPRLPIEDLDAGLYIHPEDTTVLIVTEGEESHYYVPANAYMAVQKDRDARRRTLALVNASRASLPANVQKLLDLAGFSEGDAEAMNGIIAWARS